MLTLKRTYLYAVLGIALAVMLIGLTDIARVALERVADIFRSRSYVSDDMRTELSWALALVIVATPVFLVHLGLVRRTLHGPAAAVADERACASRATYFFIVLIATGAIAGMRLVDLLETLIGTAAFGQRAWEVGAAAAGSIVVGSAWLGHAWARRHDLRVAPRHTAGDWLTRGYLYGALFVTALLGESLWRLELDDRGRVADRQRLLRGEIGRVRDVVQAPDGSLWISTSNYDSYGDPVTEQDDRILRLAPE